MSSQPDPNPPFAKDGVNPPAHPEQPPPASIGQEELRLYVGRQNGGSWAWLRTDAARNCAGKDGWEVVEMMPVAAHEAVVAAHLKASCEIVRTAEGLLGDRERAMESDRHRIRADDLEAALEVERRRTARLVAFAKGCNDCDGEAPCRSCQAEDVLASLDAGEPEPAFDGLDSEVGPPRDRKPDDVLSPSLVGGREPDRDEMTDALRRAKSDEVEDVDGIRQRAEIIVERLAPPVPVEGERPERVEHVTDLRTVQFGRDFVMVWSPSGPTQLSSPIPEDVRREVVALWSRPVNRAGLIQRLRGVAIRLHRMTPGTADYAVVDEAVDALAGVVPSGLDDDGPALRVDSQETAALRRGQARAAVPSGLPVGPSEKAKRAARVACMESKHAEGSRVNFGQIEDAVVAAYRVDAQSAVRPAKARRLDSLGRGFCRRRPDGGRMNATTIRRGLGIGADGDGQALWGWPSSARLFLSRWLGIGHWFGCDEECMRCGVPAYDADFMFTRIWPRRARCIDWGVCDDTRREYGLDDDREDGHDQ